MSDDKTVKIKECPFNHDGGDLRLAVIEDQYAVCCTCGAIGPVVSSEDEAINAWNQRQVVVVPRDVYDTMLEKMNGEEEED